jgi:hypothetical protein
MASGQSVVCRASKRSLYKINHPPRRFSSAQSPAIQTPAIQTPAVQTPAVQTPTVQTLAAQAPAVGQN